MYLNILRTPQKQNQIDCIFLLGHSVNRLIYELVDLIYGQTNVARYVKGERSWNILFSGILWKHSINAFKISKLSIPLCFYHLSDVEICRVQTAANEKVNEFMWSDCITCIVIVWKLFKKAFLTEILKCLTWNWKSSTATSKLYVYVKSTQKLLSTFLFLVYFAKLFSLLSSHFWL